MSSVLFLSPYPDLAPSPRTRIHQYLPYLHRSGVRCTISSVLSEGAYRARGVRRMVLVLPGVFRRIAEALAASRYDVVLVHREAIPLPTAALERFLGWSVRRLIFDFDDAIYLAQPHPTVPFARILRTPNKFGAMAASAHLVLAGNAHLGAHARRFNRSVRVIPTAVDTDRILPRPERDGTASVIGWIGSPSTAHYLDAIVPALDRVLARHHDLSLLLIGGSPPSGLDRTRIAVRPWSLASEPADLQAMDIGIMPLPDDEWARGKCAYKALQYMSAAVAVVSSPVGVASELIQHGENGLLAATIMEWEAALERLIADPRARSSIGRAGRASVEAGYSVRVWAPRFQQALLGSGDGSV